MKDLRSSGTTENQGLTHCLQYAFLLLDAKCGPLNDTDVSTKTLWCLSVMLLIPEDNLDHYVSDNA